MGRVPLMLLRMRVRVISADIQVIPGSEQYLGEPPKIRILLADSSSHLFMQRFVIPSPDSFI